MKILAMAASLAAAVVLSEVATASQSAKSVSATSDVTAAQDYLRRKYDEFEPLPNGQFRIFGLAYISAWAPLTAVDPSITRAYLPGVTFFQTVIHSPSVEYMKVEALVAVRRTTRGNEFRSCLSPVYDDVSPKFLALFEGISVQGHSARVAFTRCIAQLLAQITYEGRVGEVSGDGSTYRAELWHSELHWRDVFVQFSDAGLVDSVTLFKSVR